jgi:hypothetical protein
MSEWLRELSPPLRSLVYVVGVLLAFLLAIGVGAAAAMVIGGGFEGVVPGSAGNGTTEGGTLETAGPAGGSGGATMGPSGDTEDPEDAGVEASFIHRATDGNSRGDYTYIRDPSIDGDADAIVLASPGTDGGDVGAASYGHNIGVWYEPGARRWAIFNQDRAAVPAGSTFEVVVPRASEKFVHQADPSNTAGHYTYLDNRLTNGQPDAVLSITQNWNPGGGGGVYNDHPVDTQYDARRQQWAVYNKDGVTMPDGAAFNIAVSTGADQGAR